MAKRYVDANIFIYWLCGHPEFGERAKKWVERIEREGAVTSSLTLYETIVIVAGVANKNLKDDEFVKTVVDSLTGLKGLKIEPLIEEDFTNAIELMKSFNIDFEDSLHLATAMRKNASEILSNDSDFDKTPLKRVF